MAVFLFNDPNNNAYSRQYGLSKPVYLNTDLELANVPVPQPRSGTPTVDSEADPLELTVAIIQAMLGKCAEHDCQLVVMKFGRFLDWDEPEYLEDERKFERLLAEQLPNTPYLNLDEAFLARSISYEQLLAGNDEDHWNAAGHRATAEILHDFLETVIASNLD